MIEHTFQVLQRMVVDSCHSSFLILRCFAEGYCYCADHQHQETRIISMMESIARYILGKLAQEEIDELWIELLKAPEWLGYLVVEIGIRKAM